MYSYKIFRLIIIAVVIVYFSGCVWYFISTYVNTSPDDIERSFIHKYFEAGSGGINGTNVTASNGDRLIATCYFAMTTLTTAGYGDFFP